MGMAKAAWVVAAAGAAYVASGFVAMRHQSPAYCPPGDDPDPIIGCFPSFAQNAWPWFEMWGGMVLLFAVLSAPVWFPGAYRRLERRHLERHGRAPDQRP